MQRRSKDKPLRERYNLIGDLDRTFQRRDERVADLRRVAGV